jgi:REP element-mobilizing transposase RayT
MRSRYRINVPDAPYFITSTIVEWLPVFTTGACCDLLLRSFEYCREHKALRIYAWVIMENHFHAIFAGPNLASTIADLKKFTAREILMQLERENRAWLLNQLQYFRAAHKTRSQHQVWQEGVHPQWIPTDAIMLQKLEYIHNNPVKRGWVASPEHWRYSSAHEWLPGALPLLRCDEWRPQG